MTPALDAWRRWSACQGLDPQIFFPAEDDEAQIALAKAVCDGCMVRDSCLEYAIEQREHEGVWGGLTDRERRRLVRRRRRERLDAERVSA